MQMSSERDNMKLSMPINNIEYISLTGNKKDPEYGRADLNQPPNLELVKSGRASWQLVDAY